MQNPPPAILKIYPNPVNNYIIVEYDSFTHNSKVEIRSASAQTKRMNLDARSLSSGLYLAIIESERAERNKGKFNIIR